MESEQLKSFIRRYGPDILSGIATIGVGITAWLSGRAALKIDQNERYNLPKNKKESFKQTWKHYIPPAVSGLLTIFCIWGSRKMSTTQLASVAAAAGYMMTTRKKKLEPDDLKDIQPTQTIEDTGKGDVVCLEAFSGRIFRSSEEAVNDAIRDLEDVYHHEMEEKGFAYAALNELYSNLGIQTTYFGEQVGWCNEEHGDNICLYTYWADLEKLGHVLVIEPDEVSMPIMSYLYL